jgi:hypothetical protein
MDFLFPIYFLGVSFNYRIYLQANLATPKRGTLIVGMIKERALVIKLLLGTRNSEGIESTYILMFCFTVHHSISA